MPLGGPSGTSRTKKRFALPSAGWQINATIRGSARWIGEFADELTVTIALGEWDQAVTFVEQGQQSLL